MGVEKRSLIDIDDVQQRLSLEQVAGLYGFSLPADIGSSGEQRMPCPCSECAGSGDDKSVSINLSDPVKRWKCHREGYGCGAQGRLVMLAYCMKHGAMPPGGKLKGDAFWEIARELEALVDGKPLDHSPTLPAGSVRSDVQAVIEKPPNVPLADSENENARKLVHLDEQLVTELDQLSPAASSYARRRPFLLSEQLSGEVKTGFMPGKEKSSLRNNWVFGISNREGQPLAWVGRNVKYEADHKQWLEAGRHSREPNKYRFPNESLFRRSLELYGQEFLDDPRFAESLKTNGLLLVEGFTDRIRLHELGVMSVAMMSNKLTDDQTKRLIEYAREKANGRVGIMHDTDEKGDEGAKESLWRLHNAGIDAYLVWSRDKYSGRFADRQPESLTDDEWQGLATKIHR